VIIYRGLQHILTRSHSDQCAGSKDEYGPHPPLALTGSRPRVLRARSEPCSSGVVVARRAAAGPGAFRITRPAELWHMDLEHQEAM
jgi:hypothetical protein